MYLEKAFLRHFTSKEDLLLSLKVSQLSKRKSIQLKIQHCLVILCVAFLRSFFFSFFRSKRLFWKEAESNWGGAPLTLLLSHNEFLAWRHSCRPQIHQKYNRVIHKLHHLSTMELCITFLVPFLLCFSILSTQYKIKIFFWVRTRKSSDWGAGIFWPFFFWQK